MNHFGLEKVKLAVLLRDNAANGIKACKEMMINHFGCIGHSLHLLVGPFLIEKKEKATINSLNEINTPDDNDDDEHGADVSNEDGAGGSDHDDDDDIAEYQDEEDIQLPDDVVLEACKVVSKFRHVAKYIKNSPKAKEKVMQFGGGNAIKNRDRVTLLLDVRTRWNSALDMIQSVLKIKSALVTFLLHLSTTDGRKEFNRKKLPLITEEEWIFLEGLCYILTPFKNATCLLSGELYPTFTQALPTLRKLKSLLIDGAEGSLYLLVVHANPLQHI